MKIGILGTGSVASNLAQGWTRAGHDVKLGSRAPAQAREKAAKLGQVTVGTPPEAAAHGEVVAIAVPWRNLSETLQAVGAPKLKGKIVIDATNVLTPAYELAVGHTTSGAEELAKQLPGAKVFKAFNTVFAEHMSTGKINGTPIAAFVAGDDEKAKQVVLGLARDIGFDAVDAGPLRNARYLEPFGMQNIALGYGLKMGSGIGFALLRKKA